MATYEVSTWAELVNAANTARSGGDIIKLVAEIDCNDEIPTGVTSTVEIWQVSITIDGSYTENGVTKNHVIRNLRTNITSPQPIFKFVFNNSSITHRVKNIDFINLILSAPLFQVKDYYLATHYFYVQNCRFTGKRYDYLISRLAGQTSGAQGFVQNYLQYSYFNVPYYGTSENKVRLCQNYYQSGSGYFYCYADSCRIKASYNETYTPTYDTGLVKSEITNVSLNGCRIEGDIVGCDADVSYININFGVRPDRTISIQNVYDVDFYMKSISGSKNIEFNGCKGLVKRPVKDWETKTQEYNTYNLYTDYIFATESQMKDTDWLIENGFDVIPSNT